MTNQIKKIDINWHGPYLYRDVRLYGSDPDIDFYIFARSKGILRSAVAMKPSFIIIYIGKTKNDPAARLSNHEREKDFLRRTKNFPEIRMFFDKLIEKVPIINEIKYSLAANFEDNFSNLYDLLREFRMNKLLLFFGKAYYKGKLIPEELIIPIENALIVGHFFVYHPEPYENRQNLYYKRPEHYLIQNIGYPLDSEIDTRKIAVI